jgi:hypothetical protein
MYRICLAIYVVLILNLLWIWWSQRRRRPAKKSKESKPKGPRRLRPRTPKDCADCQAEVGREATSLRVVIPWSQVKNPRGRKKQKDTKGFACSNEDCELSWLKKSSVRTIDQEKSGIAYQRLCLKGK